MDIIESLIESVLEHRNLPNFKLKRHSRDGAANMSGQCNVLDTILMNIQPLAFYTQW